MKNIIFDWSGTLVDDLPPIVHATNRIFEHYNRPLITIDEFRKSFRLPFPDWYAEILPQIPIDTINEIYNQHFTPLQHSIPLLPGALEFLEFCKINHIRIFLLSTIQADHFEMQARRLNVHHFFEVPYVRVMDKRTKILEILQIHDLHPEETLFIGDMVHDIETAQHANIFSAAVLTGFDPIEKLALANPDIIVPNLTALQRWLRPALTKTKPIATVGAVIYNQKKQILLIRTHKWSNRWGIPGGKIKNGESSLDALQREIKEETNLEVRNIRFELVQDCIHSPEFFRPEHFLLLNYSAEAIHSDVVLNHEAQEFRWMELQDALQMDLNIPTRFLLENVTNVGVSAL